MATKKITPPPKKDTKKAISKEIKSKIAKALSEFKSSFREKEFERKIKKASKIFSADVLKNNMLKKEKLTVKKKAILIK